MKIIKWTLRTSLKIMRKIVLRKLDSKLIFGNLLQISPTFHLLKIKLLNHFRRHLSQVIQMIMKRVRWRTRNFREIPWRRMILTGRALIFKLIKVVWIRVKLRRIWSTMTIRRIRELITIDAGCITARIKWAFWESIWKAIRRFSHKVMICRIKVQ